MQERALEADPALAPPLAPWKRALRDAIRDPDELIDALGLPEPLRPGARRAARLFAPVVPLSFLARMRRGDPHDPLLRQVLPLDAETEQVPGFDADPLAEEEAILAPGLLRKYRGRGLLIAAGTCAVACRYCFRRHFPYDDAPTTLDGWEPAFAALAADESIDEAILSGGDPLVRSDGFLLALARRLAEIPHLRRLRVHTRLPIVVPERVDDALLSWLGATRLAPVVVVHANHPAEIDERCGAALRRLVAAGIPTLNQSVLLAGVNDDAEVLAELSRRLLDRGVLPYYLHQLDPVAGAAHFRVAEERGQAIVAELKRLLPGYAVPRYVREEPGAAHKVELAGPEDVAGRRESR